MGFSLKKVFRKVRKSVSSPFKKLEKETKRVFKQVGKLPKKLVAEAKRLPGNIGKAVGSIAAGVSNGLFGKGSLKKVALIGGGGFLLYKAIQYYIDRDVSDDSEPSTVS